MEAETFPVRGFGYLAAVTLALDVMASALVWMIRDTWQHWLFGATLLASIATLTVVAWALTAAWHAARSHRA